MILESHRIVNFFGGIKQSIMLLTAVTFIFAWFLKAKPNMSIRAYEIVPFDVFGRRVSLDGIRTKFETFDVAWSFLKQYKEAYSLYNFALVSEHYTDGKQTIYRYL